MFISKICAYFQGLSLIKSKCTYFLRNVLIFKVRACFVLEMDCVSEKLQLKFGFPKKKSGF